MLPGLHAAVDDAKARASATRARKRAEVAPADVDPVAQVLVDVPLPHLDRPFDYLVPAKDAEAAVAGARVKVRFAGQDVDGFVVRRLAESSHPGRLQPLRRVVSAEPVLTPAVAELTAAVARRWAGSRSDVLRLAIPPRHAAAEKADVGKAPAGEAAARPDERDGPGRAAASAWAHVPAADAYFRHVADGGAPRAVWQAAPGDDWPTMIAHAVHVATAAGRGALVCLPDKRDVDRLSSCLDTVLGVDRHVVLTADLGLAARYRNFLRLTRGESRVAIGTRSAAYAPVAELGLAVIWDDGDDLHVEQRAPYAHARDVLALRSQEEDAAILMAGFARSCEAALAVRSGWAHSLQPERRTFRERARIDVVPAEDKAIGSRIPRAAHDAIRDGLRHGPVLVQTPRAGYAPALACERCRAPARCGQCGGPLHLSSAASPPTCRWCGTADRHWTCAVCHHRGLRAPIRGETRTAEELGRMFPGTTVRSSGGDRVLAHVDDKPAIVVATVGGEPVADGGYRAVVILDTWATLARDNLRVEEEALRRWLGAAGLVRVGARVVAVGDPGLSVLQALVRWDPAGFADRELEQRASAHLPPAARLASIVGDKGALSDALTLLDLPPHAELLGPVPVDTPVAGPGHRVKSEHRAIVRAPLAQSEALTDALLAMQRTRSARKLDAVRVRVDPPEL